MSTVADKFEFAIAGAGWRSEFFLDVAAALPRMNVAGLVSRNPERSAEIESRWNVPCFGTISELLRVTTPSFVVASVPAGAMPQVCLELASHGTPILAETPPASDYDGLVDLYRRLGELGADIQVAEQYWAQPLHAARQAIVDSGLLGRIDQVHFSVCHGYHAMSLMRRLLGIKGEVAIIRGQRFTGTVTAGPDRNGPPQTESTVDVETDYAWLDFGDRFGLYEFCLPQYRSWIRGQRVCIRGERGEIIDSNVTFLEDEVTPISATLLRHEAGRNGNLEGLHLKGIQCLDRWVYENPFVPARLSDEEIAVARCLLAMQRYIESGESFYTLAEASQDQYLALMCTRAIDSGQAVRTEAQPWNDQI